MHKIFDGKDDPVASIPLSEQNLKLLDAGIEVSVQYHTPRVLQPSLGAKAGQFSLYKKGTIKTRDVAAVKEYANIQAAYRALNPSA